MASNIPQITISPYTYTQTAPANFGQAYGESLATAGKNIGAAVQGVGDILQKNATTNDLLTQFSQMKGPDGNPIISGEDYQNIMNKGMGAKQELLGSILTNFHSQYQSMLDTQRQLAVQGQQGAQRLGEIAATGEQQRQTARVEHPEMTLAPKIVASTASDDQTQKLVQQKIEENRRKATAAYVAPP